MRAIKSILMILLIMSITLSGCSIMNNSSKDKPHGEVIESDTRTFIFEDIAYTILNETVSKEDLSSHVGTLGKLVFIRKDFKAVGIEANLTYKDFLKKLTDDYPSDAYYFA
ncbi:MAG: hypothetical protein RR347_09345 [Anaerovoracaceae bacterium]